MCAPEFNFIKVPTPIIINGIAFDEEDFDPIDFEFDDDFEFDEAVSDIIPLFISDTESYESLSDFIDQGKYLLLVFWDYGLFGQYLFVLSNRTLCRIHIILLLRTHWLLWLLPLEFKS